MNESIKPQLVKSEIISCSRRTDIPAFLMNWVMERINIGYVDVVNPFNRKQISRVSLNPKYVKCWVWWSKDFGSWIENYKVNKSIFNQYKGHFFQFTINSPSILEKNLRSSLDERYIQLSWLIDNFGEKSISYRFDPIIFYKQNGKKEIYNNLDKFEDIVERISAFKIKTMTFSFATLYSKVQNRMNSRGFIPLDLKQNKKMEVLKDLLQICNRYGIHMKSCCQQDLLELEGIEQAHCIDANIIEELIGEPIIKKKDTGQRKECGCFKSKDIGGYSGIFRCKHNCDYCYASPAKL